MEKNFPKKPEGWVIKSTRDSENTLDVRYGYTPSDSSCVEKWVLFLNGRAEWIEKYRHLPHDLNLGSKTGFVTMDHRGQGASGGLQSYIESYDQFAMDVQNVAGKVIGDKKFVSIGHSMGGLINLYSVMRGFIQPKAVVLSSPLLGMPNWPVSTRISRPIVNLLSKTNLKYVNAGGGRFERPPFELNWLTHDHDKYMEMKNSPFPIPSPTVGWAEATFAACEFIFNPENLKRLKVPVLVLGATGEKCVDISAFQKWVDVASQHAQAPISFHWIQGARHELLAEAPQYYQQALMWVKEFLRSEIS